MLHCKILDGLKLVVFRRCHSKFSEVLVSRDLLIPTNLHVFLSSSFQMLIPKELNEEKF